MKIKTSEYQLSQINFHPNEYEKIEAKFDGNNAVSLKCSNGVNCDDIIIEKSSEGYMFNISVNDYLDQKQVYEKVGLITNDEMHLLKQDIPHLEYLTDNITDLVKWSEYEMVDSSGLQDRIDLALINQGSDFYILRSSSENGVDKEQLSPAQALNNLLIQTEKFDLEMLSKHFDKKTLESFIINELPLPDNSKKLELAKLDACFKQDEIARFNGKVITEPNEQTKNVNGKNLKLTSFTMNLENDSNLKELQVRIWGSGSKAIQLGTQIAVSGKLEIDNTHGYEYINAKSLKIFNYKSNDNRVDQDSKQSFLSKASMVMIRKTKGYKNFKSHYESVGPENFWRDGERVLSEVEKKYYKALKSEKKVMKL